MLQTNNLRLELYIANDEDQDQKYLIDATDLQVVKRDIDVILNHEEELLHLEIIDELGKAFFKEIKVVCGDDEHSLRLNGSSNVFVINTRDLKDLCETSIRLDLWIEDNDYIWGFSKKIDYGIKRFSYKLLEDKINDLLKKISVSLKDRLIENYEIVVLPREKELVIKVANDAYYALVGNDEIRLNRLSKGINVISLRNILGEDFILIKVFDGLRHENLIIRLDNIVRDIVYAYKHAIILKELLISRG